jgi:plastocyanin
MLRNSIGMGLRRVPVIVAIVLLSVGSAIVAATAQLPSPATMDVKIDNFSFGPETLTVAAGTTVTWINRDDIPHKVVSTDEVFKSKVLDTDEKFSYTFAKTGIFPYFCSIHPKMTGKVVVK